MLEWNGVRCSSCKSAMRYDARICPHCRTEATPAELSKRKTDHRGAMLLAGGLAVAAVFGLSQCFGSDSETTPAVTPESSRTELSLDAVTARVRECKTEYDGNISNRETTTCYVLYGENADLSDACFPATDKAGDVLYAAAKDRPTEAQWKTCFGYIDDGVQAPESKVRQAVDNMTATAVAMAAEMKRSTNDPDAFEIVGAKAGEDSICFSVRGKNAFGAKVVQNLVFTGGKPIESPTQAQWSKACDDAKDITKLVRAGI